MNKSTAINMILEFVDNGAILEYPEQGAKYVVEGEDNEPYNSIGEDIKQAITGIEVSNRYRISITIEAL
jgi:hypothetical protein